MASNIITKALRLGNLTDVNKGTSVPDANNYTTLMPNVGDIYYRTGQTDPELYIRQSTYIVNLLDTNEWTSPSSLNFTPTVYDPDATDIWFDLNTSGGATTIATSVIGQSRTVYCRCTYDFDSSSNTTGTPQASVTGLSNQNFTSASDYKNTASFSVTRSTVGYKKCEWVANGFTHNDGGGDGAQVVDGDMAGSSNMWWGQYHIWGSTNDSAVPVLADISDASGWSGTTGGRTLKTSGHTSFGTKQIAYGNNCRILFSVQTS